MFTDWVQNAGTAANKWGDIAKWDVSGVEDFNMAFSTCRKQDGSFGQCPESDGAGTNPKAVYFTGTGLEKWDTGSVTDMKFAFYQCAAMNANLETWNVVEVKAMNDEIFKDTTALTTCNKRKIAAAWGAGNSAFQITPYTDWAGYTGTCPVRLHRTQLACRGLVCYWLTAHTRWHMHVQTCCLVWSKRLIRTCGLFVVCDGKNTALEHNT